MNDKEQAKLAAYTKAVNRIDDWFEYANESLKDRERVHEILGELSEDLQKIYKPQDKLYYGGPFCGEEYYECAIHKNTYPKGATCPRCESEPVEENLCPKHKVPVPKWEACPLCEGEN